MGRRRQVPFQLIMVDCDIDFFEVGVMVMEMMVTVNTDAEMRMGSCRPQYTPIAVAAQWLWRLLILSGRF